MWKRISMARDEDFLGSLDYRHEVTDENMDADNHKLTAHSDGEPVGQIEWISRKNKNTIKEIWVTGDNRHKGLATELYNRAKDIAPNLKHSDTMTPMGRGWANTLNESSSEHAQKLDDQYFWQ